MTERKRMTWRVSASLNDLQYMRVGVLMYAFPTTSQTQLTLHILKKMECQNLAVSSNGKQKQNGNDHQLTFADGNLFLSNAIRILHPYQAMKFLPQNFSIQSKPWKSSHSSATSSQHNWRPSRCWNLYKLKYFVPNI